MMQNDQFPNGAVAVTPSDTVNLAKAAAAFSVGTAGDVSIVDLYGNTVVVKNVAAGFQFFVGHTRINATGTTALNITSYFQ